MSEQSRFDYAALRFRSAKDLSSMASDVKSGEVVVEPVYVEALGKRVLKFRCPPGTARGGKWTDRLGSDCHVGNARAGLAKITHSIHKINGIVESHKPGLPPPLPGSKPKLSTPPLPGSHDHDGDAGMEALEHGEHAAEHDVSHAAADAEHAIHDASFFSPFAPPEGVPLAEHKPLEPPHVAPVEPVHDPVFFSPFAPPAGEPLAAPGATNAGAPIPPPPPLSQVYHTPTPPPPPPPHAVISPAKEGVLPEPKRTILAKPVEAKKPTGPAKASSAALDAAVGKKPGQQFGNAFKVEKNAMQAAQHAALDNQMPAYVTKGPDGKLRVVDEQRMLADGHAVVAAFDLNGTKIDLTAPADHTEVVADTTAATVAAAEEAAAQAVLPVPAEPLQLVKSKTGAFLPDNFNANMLAPAEVMKFQDAFQNQRVYVWNFWTDKLGAPFNDSKTPQESLAAIDHAIAAAEANGVHKTTIGVMKAERNNFIAMWVPHDGAHDVNAFERINFVGPKRRTAIIADANLGHLVIGAAETHSVAPNLAEPAAKWVADNQGVYASALSMVGASEIAKEISGTVNHDVHVMQAADGSFHVGNKVMLETHPWSAADEAVGVLTFHNGKATAVPTVKSDLGMQNRIVGLLDNPAKSNVAVLGMYLNSHTGKAEPWVEGMKQNDFWKFRDAAGHIDIALWDTQRAAAEDAAYQANKDALAAMNDKGYLTKDELAQVTDAHMRALAFEQLNQQVQSLHAAEQTASIDAHPDKPAIDTKAAFQAKSNIVGANALLFNNMMESENWQQHVVAAATANTAKDSGVPPASAFLSKDEINQFFNDAIKTHEHLGEQAVKAVNDKVHNGLPLTEAELVHAYFDSKASVEFLKAEHAATLAEWDAQHAAHAAENATVTANHDTLAAISSGDKHALYAIDAKTGKVTSITLANTSKEDWNHFIVAADNGSLFHNGKKVTQTAANKLYLATSNGGETTAVAAEEAKPVAEATKIAEPVAAGHEQLAAVANLLADTPNFDFSKISSAEGAKMGDTPSSVSVRYDKYGKNLAGYLAALPADFHTLPADEQRAALRTATGQADDLQAAKFFARAAFSAQYGSSEGLKALSDALSVQKGDATAAVKGAVLKADADAAIAKAEDKLALAEQRLADMPKTGHQAVQLIYTGQLADARNELTAAWITKHLQAIETGAPPKEMGQIGKEMNSSVALLDPKLRLGIEKQLNNGLAIEKGDPGILAAKGMLPTSGFDSSILGTVQPDGRAVAYSIPVGHKSIWTAEDASAHLASGGQLSDIPDAFLKDAIWSNMGGRFQPLKGMNQGYNETAGVVDTKTGNTYILKMAHRNEMEHIQEVAGARLAQVLGEHMVGMRFGSELTKNADLPPEQKAAEGVKVGSQRAIVLDAVHNMFQGPGYTVYSSFDKVPAGAQIDGESLARMMALDRTMNYFDRTAANIVAVKGPDGLVHLHPIDSGNAFRAWGGSGKEETKGFITKTKGDNVDLFKLAQNLSPEERTRFAAALLDANKRYQRTDFASTFKNIADTMKANDAERARLAKHAQFLEDRKTSLDWEKMHTDALKGLGYTDQQVQDMLHPPLPGGMEHGFVLPKTHGNLANLHQRVSAMPAKGQYVSVVYGGNAIEDMEVRTQPLMYKGFGAAGSDKYVQGTQMSFKRRDAAAAVVDPAHDPQWQKLGAVGHIRATWGQDGHARISFTSPEFTPGSSNYAKAQTYYRVLPDGTIATITLGPGQDGKTETNTAYNAVRLVFPGDSSKLTPERVQAAMEAVGVTHHDAPTTEHLREYGIRAAYSTLFGNPPKTHKVDTLAKKIQAEYGITEADFATSVSPTGRIEIGLTPEGAKKLATQGGKPTLGHHFNSDNLFSMLMQGELLSTLRRFDHASNQTGSSSPQDFGQKGSADFVYTSKHGNAIENMGVSSGIWYTPAELQFRRLGFHTFNHDAWGNVHSYQGFSTGMGSTGNEVDFKGGLDATKGVFQVTAAQKQNVIAQLHAAGVYDVNGVPIDDLLASSKDEFLAKVALLKERWGLNP